MKPFRRAKEQLKRLLSAVRQGWAQPPATSHGALSLVMPDAQETLLLKAVLGDRAAWDLIRGDLHKHLRQRPWLRRLAPHLHAAQGHTRPPTVLRLAGLYEPMRWLAYRNEVEQTLLRLSQADIPLRLPRGPVLNEYYYPQPALRHCHDLDLILSDRHLNRARATLTESGYQWQGDAWLHPSGLSVKLHTQALAGHPLAESAWRQDQVCGVEVQVLSAAGLLVLISGHALIHAPGPPWVVDAWHVLRSPRLTSDQVIELAQHSELTLPVLAVVEYLARLGASVPDALLRGLQSRAATASAPTRQAAWERVARHPGVHPLAMALASRGISEKVALLWWFLQRWQGRCLP